MGFLDVVSKIALTSAVITLVAFIVHVVGFASPFWVANGDNHRGIWVFCYPTCSSYPGGHPPWLKAVQATETLAFLVLLGCIVLSGLRLTVMMFKPVVRLVLMILQFSSAALILIGVIIISIQDDKFDRYHFAFFFEVIAACLALIAGTLSILDWRKGNSIVP